MILGLAATLALTACEKRPDDIPVDVSVIGANRLAADPRRGPMPTGARVLRDSVAQGLVRFDAAGGIEPGLAERWIVIDDGRSIIFRLKEATWSDGRPVVADDVVRQLKRALGSGSRNTLLPYLTAIDEIVAMTPQVIEVRLSRPRPDLLKLFAQPELGITAPDGGEGSGPFRIAEASAASVLLRPIDDPTEVADDRPDAPKPQDLVRLRAERASTAILRFAQRRSDLVEGGTFLDWPMIDLSDVAPANVRLDPAAGLFGLLVARRDGFLSTRDNRSAIALAIDRAALTAAFSDGWAPTDTILPEALDSTSPPAQPDWSSVPDSERLAMAQARVVTYRRTSPDPLVLRIALPEGPGATLLYGQIAAAIARLGITTERVAIDDATAHLRLIDRVAPYDSARWYLRAACQPCALPIARLIAEIRLAPDVATRARMLAQADSALTADVAFIPLARPLRWSLVAPRLRQWTPNARAFHPLNRLRTDPK
ncbi:ABC transporter substrate-binding protein [Sphingomonas sp. Leaf33]|nr:ABC transporter substrate-binding protein [Sphingomonas sp. Leaf33]